MDTDDALHHVLLERSATPSTVQENGRFLYISMMRNRVLGKSAYSRAWGVSGDGADKLE